MSLAAQDPRVTRTVGGIAMALGVAAIVFFVFLWDRIEWGERVRLPIYFKSTGGLQEGAPVIVAGTTIGKVESIALATQPRHDDGVIVRVALDAGWAKKVDASGDIFVTSRGVLSERYLEIGPPSARETPRFPAGTMLVDIAKRTDVELEGREPPTLDRVLQRTLDNLNTASAFSAGIKPALADLQRELDGLRATMDGIAPDIAFRADVVALLDEGRQTYAALGGDPGVARIGEVRARASDVLGQARATVASLRASATLLEASIDTLKTRVNTRGATAIERIELAIDRIKAAIDKIDPLLAQAEQLQQQLARGDGSLMKLMHDPEFPEDAKELGKILKRQPWKLIDRPIK